MTKLLLPLLLLLGCAEVPLTADDQAYCHKLATDIAGPGCVGFSSACMDIDLCRKAKYKKVLKACEDATRVLEKELL